MAVLNVVCDHIYHARVFSVRKPRALLQFRVEVSIDRANQIVGVSLQKLHVWLSLRVARPTLVDCSVVVNIEATIHELQVSLEIRR